LIKFHLEQSYIIDYRIRRNLYLNYIEKLLTVIDVENLNYFTVRLIDQKYYEKSHFILVRIVIFSYSLLYKLGSNFRWPKDQMVSTISDWFTKFFIKYSECNEDLTPFVQSFITSFEQIIVTMTGNMIFKSSDKKLPPKLFEIAKACLENAPDQNIVKLFKFRDLYLEDNDGYFHIMKQILKIRPSLRKTLLESISENHAILFKTENEYNFMNKEKSTEKSRFSDDNVKFKGKDETCCSIYEKEFGDCQSSTTSKMDDNEEKDQFDKSTALGKKDDNEENDQFDNSTALGKKDDDDQFDNLTTLGKKDDDDDDHFDNSTNLGKEIYDDDQFDNSTNLENDKWLFNDENDNF